MSGTGCIRVAWMMVCTLMAGVVAALDEHELRGNLMGSSVAMDGDYAVTGASSWNSNQGRVYVHKRQADGTWSQTAILTASDYGGSYSAFGTSVGISGDWIIVGAPWYHEGANYTGRVYFFKRNGDESWTEKASIGSVATEPDSHGSSVAIDGIYAVAGDPGAGMNNAGCITVYKRVGDVWNLFQCRVHNPNGWVRALGSSVDICTIGDVAYIAAGAPGSYLDAIQSDRAYGRAFSFTTTFAGSLSPVEIVCQDVANQECFGSAVSIDYSDRGQLSVAVGAYANEGAWLDETGAVYVFNFGAILWTQVAKLRPPIIATEYMRYGSSISLRNDVLAAVGDWGLDWYPAISGLNAPVYLYYRHQGGQEQWGLFDEVRSKHYEASEMDFGGFCASSSVSDKGLALSGSSVLVGAPARQYLVDDVRTTGAAFVFTPGPGVGARPAAAGVRISEIADNSPSNRSSAAYIEIYNPTNVFVSLADTLLVIENPQFLGGKDGGENLGYYRFSPFTTIPSNGCLVVSAKAFMDEFEQHWGVDLDTAPYNYEIGADTLQLGEGCAYRLEQINRGSVPNPDTTNLVDRSVAAPGGCRTVHDSTAMDDWSYGNSMMCSPGVIDANQFIYAPRSLPFTEDFSSYDFAANGWSFTDGLKGHWSADAKYPEEIATFYWAPYISSSFSYGLETPLLSGRAKETVLLGFDLRLVMYPHTPAYFNKNNKVEIQVAAAGGVWNTMATYTDLLGDTTWNGQSVDISSYARDQYFKVRFLVSGPNTAYLYEWLLDNISINATEPVLTPPTITRLTLNPLMLNSLQMTWSAGSKGRLHRVYYGTNLVEGINEPLGTFSESTFIMRPPPQVNGAPAVFFRIQSLP